MNRSETTPRSSPTRRKLRRSTFVFLAFVVAVLVLLNLPGESVVGPDLFANGKYGPHFGFSEHCEHGWPFTYLRREGLALNGPVRSPLSQWNVFQGVDRFDAILLIADVAIGGAIALLAALLFESWRRKRQRLLQFHVCDLLVLAGVVSAGAAVFVFHRTQQTAEQAVLQTIENNRDPNVEWGVAIVERIEWQPGGPSWLRKLVGDRPFELFDRVVGIEASGVDLKHAAQLRYLKVVRIGNVSNRQLRMLERLSHLEALDMCYAALDDEGHNIVDEDGAVVEQYFRLPRMPKLRGLNLYGAAFRGDGLENIPSIEVLDLTDTEIDDDSVPALAALTQLKELSVHGTSISDAGIAQLRKALPDCKIQR